MGRLHADHPGLTGDQLYNAARAITTAEYQNIVYREFVPTIVGQLKPYNGYKAKVSTQISEEFATAAYRFGHSTVSGEQTQMAKRYVRLPWLRPHRQNQQLQRGPGQTGFRGDDIDRRSALRKTFFNEKMTPNDFRDVRVQATGGGSLVSFDNNHILLSGISPRQLSASNFIFNQDDAALQTNPPHA